MGNSKRIIVSIDPGSGISSPTGLTVFDPHTKDILYASNITTKFKLLSHRIKDITDKVYEIFKEIEDSSTGREIVVTIESFVMRGKGGETLQRLIGGFLAKTPYMFRVEHVQNSTIKKVLAGHGHADKNSVAAGTLDFFASNKDSVDLIKRLLSKQELDILDSLAIGVTWVKQNEK